MIKDNIDLMSLSGHKMYGPKGVGALYVRRRSPRVQLTAQMDGGGHERGMRSGTLNVPGIVGMGEACAIAKAEMAEEAKRLEYLRDKMKDRLLAALDEVYINGTMEHRLPNNLNISFAYVEGESLLMGINDIAVSSGSACTSATLEPSYVLKALGAGDDLAHSSIRFGLGRFNTEEEVDYVTAKVIDVVKKLRELSPLYEMFKEGIDLSKVQWTAHYPPIHNLPPILFKGDSHGIFRKSCRSLQPSPQRGLDGQIRSERGHGHGRCPGMRRRDEAASKSEPGHRDH